jgi:uncharacterized LabA/DUF88 family protein
MQTTRFFPQVNQEAVPTMVFVDGENLAIRYGALLKEKQTPIPSHVRYKPDIYVWSLALNNLCFRGGVVRRHYYTSVQGDEDSRLAVIEALKDVDIESPQVFKRTKTRGSKRVDIQLTTDLLLHASRKNFEVAVLIAGDEDYVPLVEAVTSEGRRVFVWFLSSGMSPALRRAADRFGDLDELLLSREPKDWK